MPNVLIITLIIMCRSLVVLSVERPTIGILALEFEEKDAEKYKPATSHIMTPYVKSVESAGARVVPIFIRKSYTYYKHLLHAINGIVIPGGNANLQPGNGYYDAFAMIYKIAKDINDRGIFFPIFAICLGFEAMLIISNNNTDMQTRCDIVNEYYPLEFQPNYKTSLMYSALPYEIYIYLKYFDATGNWHYWCTTPTNLTKYGLDAEWTATTLNHNQRGLVFVSSVEHKKYPFFGVQFHPERQFSEFFPHDTKKYTPIAIKANRYFYERIVDLARMNENKFQNDQEKRDLLIYKYSPKYVKNPDSFNTLYAFYD